MLITRFHDSPPSQTVGLQVLQLVEEYVTELSMLSVPVSNPLYEIYRWALPVEVGAYIGDGRENGQNRTLSMRPVRLRP